MINRREFVKYSVLASGAIAAGSVLPFCTPRERYGGMGAIGNDALLKVAEQAKTLIRSLPDTVCLERARLLTEAYQLFGNEPLPILRAKALDHILKNMTLDLNTNPIFAGNCSSGPRKWMLRPEDGFGIPGQAIIENPALQGHLDGDVIPADIREFWKGRSSIPPTGHLIVNNHKLLTMGLEQVMQEAATKSGNGKNLGPDEQVYYQACILSCQAVMDWAARYAAEARQKAEKERDSIRRDLLLSVAEACEQVPAKPARNMHEAMQSLLIMQFALHIEGHGYSINPGRVDQLLLPYYVGDENSTGLFTAFLLKLYEVSLWGSHSKTQTITLGGCDQFGNDACNPLTGYFLDALVTARVPDPNVFLRWHHNMSEEIKQKAIQILLGGQSMPMLVGDVETTAGLITKGVKPADAWNYAVIGCNELGIEGKLIFESALMPELNNLRDTILTPQIRQVNNIDGLIELAGENLKKVLKAEIESLHRGKVTRENTFPTPLTSALMDNCFEKGKDYLMNTEYPFHNLLSVGYTNTVNALTAIDHVVFKNKQADMDDIARALTENFEGHDRLRKQLADAPKWGNDDDIADPIALKWLEKRHAIVLELEQELYGQVLMEEVVTRSLHHLFGSQIKATPDGRLDKEIISDSVGAQPGFYFEGPTAMLNSVMKMKPAVYWPGGYNLNIALPLMRSYNEAVTSNVLAMTEVFFGNGGQELQINALNEEILLEAMAHPERYPNLIVRIAGFNGYFAELSEVEQLELLDRAKSMM
jgi:pyruvate-formate lyase